MEFNNIIIFGPWKSWQIKVFFGSLVTTDDKARIMKDKRGIIKQFEWHAFWWIPRFVYVELCKVKKYAKTSKVLKIFESES